MTSPWGNPNPLQASLHALAQMLESLAAVAGAFPSPVAPQGLTVMPVPPTPIPPPTTAPEAVPADYTQQLLTSLQAWRQYLGQAAAASPGAQTPPAQPPPPTSDGLRYEAGSAPGTGETVRTPRVWRPPASEVVPFIAANVVDVPGPRAETGGPVPAPPALEFGAGPERVRPDAPPVPAPAVGAQFKGLRKRTPGVD